MDEGTVFDFGLLVAPSTDSRYLSVLPDLAPDLTWSFGKLTDHVSEAAKLRGFEQHVGRVGMRDMTQEGLLVYCVRRSPFESVQHRETERIAERLERVVRALELVDFGVPTRGTACIVTGSARSEKAFDIDTVNGLDPFPEYVSPYYASDPATQFWQLRPQLLRPAGSWADQWADNVRLVDRLDGALPQMLRVGLYAFVEGLTSNLIEFRIPNFVRATEAVLALPKHGGGAKEFARRAALLVPELERDPFLGPGLQDRLLRMYVLRNECVHGMIPFANMQLQGPAQDLEARRIEYLAERLARRATLHGLHRAHEPYFVDRQKLEAAWQSGTMP